MKKENPRSNRIFNNMREKVEYRPFLGLIFDLLKEAFENEITLVSKWNIFRNFYSKNEEKIEL